MGSNNQENVYLKPFLFACILIFILFIILQPNNTPSTMPFIFFESNAPPSNLTSNTSCTKLPSSIAKTIIHYTASKITPQQTIEEISVVARVLEKRSPCNFLVFGLGHDSLMWSALNYGGRTVFLEENKAWIENVGKKFPMLEFYHVTYDTKVKQVKDLLELAKLPKCTTAGDLRSSKCRLALKGFPDVFYELEWDLIMIDAPTGYHPEAPGRMGVIYTAGMAARWRKEDGAATDIFVHDVNRFIEDKFTRTFLCEGYMKEEAGLLRHFTIPSHRNRLNMPFCPSALNVTSP